MIQHVIALPQNYSPCKQQPDTQEQENDPNICISKHNHTHEKNLDFKLKSSLCKNFTMTGHCPYGKKCQFAHGFQELRCNKNANTSYKTKVCFNFIKQGYCIYGHRCNYIHNPVKVGKIGSKMMNNFPQLLVEVGGTRSRLMDKLYGGDIR